MKLYHLVSALTFISLLLLLVTACHREENPSTYITYSVSCYTDKPYRLCIIYKDSTQKEEIYTESNWSKEVYLPSGTYPSLLVFMEYLNEEDQITKNDDYITAKIIHPTETVSYSSKRVAYVCL